MSTPLPEGRARGMAYVESFGSLCAEVAEASLREGSLSCIAWSARWTAAGGAAGRRTPQVEGGVSWGCPPRCASRCASRTGRAVKTLRRLQAGADCRCAERIDTVIIESAEPMGGVGELSLPPIAPAVATRCSRYGKLRDGCPCRRPTGPDPVGRAGGVAGARITGPASLSRRQRRGCRLAGRTEVPDVRKIATRSSSSMSRRATTASSVAAACGRR